MLNCALKEFLRKPKLNLLRRMKNELLPRLYINSIDFNSLTMNFDLYFPLIDTPENEILSPVFIKSYDAISCYMYDFYGNYSKTNFGWFQMLKEAYLNGEKIEFPMAEVFYDSPFSGGDDKNWKSQTFFNFLNKV